MKFFFFVFCIIYINSNIDSQVFASSSLVNTQKKLNQQKQLNVRLKSDQEKLIEFQSNPKSYLEMLKKQNASLKRKLSILVPNQKNGLSIEEQLKRVRSQNSALKNAFTDLTNQKLQPIVTQNSVVQNLNTATGVTNQTVVPADDGIAISPLLFKAAFQKQRVSDSIGSSNEGPVATKADFLSQKRTIIPATDVDNAVRKEDFKASMTRSIG